MTEKQSELIQRPEQAVSGAQEPLTVARFIDGAIAAGRSAEDLKGLYDLYREEQARIAEQEFNAALADFQAACPPIPKTSKADFVTKQGTRVRYSFASLDQIKKTAGPHLHRLGLSYTWDSEVQDKTMCCTCILRHRNGHSTTATFTVPIEGTQLMSEPQKHKAALTFAERVALIQVLGLTDCNEDTGGETLEPISEKQARDLESFIAEIGDEAATRAKVLKFVGAGSIAEILQSQHAAAVNLLQAIRKQKG